MSVHESIDQQGKTKNEAPNNSSGLFDVLENEGGGFDVAMPGLVDYKNGQVVSVCSRHFETKEDAAQAVEEARRSLVEMSERESLSKSYTKYFYRIDEIQEGKFRVTIPGGVDSKNGYYIGVACRDFDSWSEARDYYLQQRESDENLTQKPLLEIKTGKNEKIAFSDFELFNPQVAPSKTTHEIPSSIEKYLLNKEQGIVDDQSASTYQETIKEKEWESGLYSFISTYLENDGSEILKQLGIKHLDSLTPKQAAELATQIVVDLTKYKLSDATEQKNSLSRPDKTKADQSTALQLLREGQLKAGDHDWEGNGVCRNFACLVKAVFEALKAKQTKFNRLQNTYCIYETGKEEFAPERKRNNEYKTDHSGHAWNTFVTVSKEGAANAVIVDVTWAKRDLETKKVEKLDYTLTRMEPVVSAVGLDIARSAQDKDEQLKHILSFYLLKIERLGSTGIAINPNERQFYATRVLELIRKHGVPTGLPESLVEFIEKEYLKIADDADNVEIETIFEIAQSYSGLNFLSIFKNYLKSKQLEDYHAESFIFKNDDLQKLAFDELKLNKNFYSFLKESPKFRVRMREVLPQLFIDFSPATKPEDMSELVYLTRNSNCLRAFDRFLDPHHPSEENIKKFFLKAKENLQNLNPDMFGKVAGGLDDYVIIKSYDLLFNQLQGK